MPGFANSVAGFPGNWSVSDRFEVVGPRPGPGPRPPRRGEPDEPRPGHDSCSRTARARAVIHIPVFHLVRYFSIASLACFVLATAALWQWHRQTEIGELIDTGTKLNRALAALVDNTLWPAFGAFVETGGRLGDEALRADARNAELDQAVRALLRGTTVVKIKLYDLSGGRSHF